MQVRTHANVMMATVLVALGVRAEDAVQANAQSGNVATPDIAGLTKQAEVIFEGRSRLLYSGATEKKHLMFNEVREILKERDAEWRVGRPFVSFTNDSRRAGKVTDKDFIVFMEQYPGSNAVWYVVGRDASVGLVESTSNVLSQVRSLVAEAEHQHITSQSRVGDGHLAIQSKEGEPLLEVVRFVANIARVNIECAPNDFESLTFGPVLAPSVAPDDLLRQILWANGFDFQMVKEGGKTTYKILRKASGRE